MQRYGPPPSYPNLKVPGLNAPIPEVRVGYSLKVSQTAMVKSRDAHLATLLAVGASLQLMRLVDHCMVMCLVWITATKESKQMST